MDQTYMKEKPVFRLLMSMALPMVLSMAVNSLYNIVDGFFVAKINEDSMTALSLVYPLQNLLVAVSVGFGIGINARASYFLGAGEKEKADNAAAIGLILNILHGVLLTIAGLLLMPSYIGLFTDSEEVFAAAWEYSFIILLFTVPNFIGITFEKIFQSVGRMNVSMIALAGGCVINIILDPLMIFGIGFFPEMGIRGAAIATGIGQTSSMLIYLVFCAVSPLSLKLKPDFKNLNLSFIKKLYGVGLPASLNMALPSMLISVLNSILSAFNGPYVLVLGAYYKLQTFIYLSANGVVQGMRPIIGYNYGAGEVKRVKKIFVYALAVIAGIMAVGTVLSLAVPDKLIGLFSDNEATIKEGATALRIISSGFLISAVSVTAAGALEGAGKGFSSLVVSICRYALFIIPLAFVLGKYMGANGVWLSFGIGEALSTVASVFLLRGAYTALLKEKSVEKGSF